MATEFRINGQAVNSDAPTATPLLWMIREQRELTGTNSAAAPACAAPAWCISTADGHSHARPSLPTSPAGS